MTSIALTFKRSANSLTVIISEIRILVRGAAGAFGAGADDATEAAG